MPDLSFFFDKEPEEIVRWYQSKGLKISYNWRDIWQEAQVKAFTVAKAMDLDILQDIKSEVVEAIKKGNTYEEFRRNLEPRLKAKGWWGKQDMVNPNTGETETVQLGSPWRLKTIYRTNVSVAYSAGRYKKFLENAEDRPFWQYNAVLDKRTRPLHAILDGKVFRYDDPFWQTHFPPNDWGCRCSVTALNKRDIDRDGLKVENNSGEWLSKVPAGEGWNYNPGNETWFPDLDKYDYDLAARYFDKGLTTPDFSLFMQKKIKGDMPVGVLNNELKELIGAKNQTVYFSSESRDKNLKNHTDLDYQDYLLLPKVITDSQLIIQDSESTLLFINNNESFYYAAVKSTKTGGKMFLTSFRKTSLKKMLENMKKGKVILNRM